MGERDAPSADLLDRARAWLREDRAADDVTALALVPAGLAAEAVVRAKEAGVVAGLEAAWAVFVAAGVTEFEQLVADGDRVAPGTVLLRARGDCRALLAAERIALNLLQRSGGIATATARYVAAVAGTSTVILATRKTGPGLRDLDVAAVRAGGGDVHRLSLADRVLVKENHITAFAGRRGAAAVAQVVARLTGADGPRRQGARVPIGIEVTDLDELEAALAPGVAVVLVDNFTPELCAQAVERRDAAFPAGDGPSIEASGGITFETVRDFAAAGVERISVGALTHSVRALDVSLLLTHEGSTHERNSHEPRAG